MRAKLLANITIRDLEVFYRVGVPEEERARPQRLLLTVEMTLDIASAASSDRIQRTVDYFEVAQHLLRLGKDRSWKLIEKVAADVAELILKTYRPESVTVEVKKFPIAEARHVSVRLAKRRTGNRIRRSPVSGAKR